MTSTAQCAPTHLRSPVSRLPLETLAFILCHVCRSDLLRISTTSRAWRASARFDQRFFLCANIRVRTPKRRNNDDNSLVIQLARSSSIIRYAWRHSIRVHLSLQVNKKAYRFAASLDGIELAIPAFIALWTAARTFISSLRITVDADRLALLERELRGRAPRLYSLRVTNMSRPKLSLSDAFFADGTPNLRVLNLDNVLPGQQVLIPAFRRVRSANVTISDRASLQDMRIRTILPSIKSLELHIHTGLECTETFSELLDGTQLDTLLIYGAPRLAFGSTYCLQIKHISYIIEEPLDWRRFLMRPETSGNMWSFFPSCGTSGAAVGLDVLRGPSSAHSASSFHPREHENSLVLVVYEPLTGMTRRLSLRHPDGGLRHNAWPLVAISIQTIRTRLTSITVCPETVWGLPEVGEMPALGRLVVQLRDDWLDSRGLLIACQTGGVIDAPALTSVALSSATATKVRRVSTDMFRELAKMIGLGGHDAPHVSFQLHDVKIFKL